MTMLHRPRVAWQAARVFVYAAEAGVYYWLDEMIGRYLGVMYELYLADTRSRLEADETALYAELGAWRARLEELLDLHPELTSTIDRLTIETQARLNAYGRA